jgi:hypothetical protein
MNNKYVTVFLTNVSETPKNFTDALNKLQKRKQIGACLKNNQGLHLR